MLLFVGEPYYKIITAVEGTGDNLSHEDIEAGYKDYYMTSIYEQDGEELKLLDSGQLLTTELIADMEYEEQVEKLKSFWGLNDTEDYVILEH